MPRAVALMRTTIVALLALFVPSLARAQAQEVPAPPPAPDATPTPTPAPAPETTPTPTPDSAPDSSPAPSPAAAPTLSPEPAPASAPTPTLSPGPELPAEKPAPKRAEAPFPDARISQTNPDDNAWNFEFHGYLRAPMRIGFGRRLPEDTNGYTITGQSDLTIHEATIPDDQYLSFQSTTHNPRAWAEGFFTVGNAWASATLGISSYNLTEGGFSDPEAQLGISHAFVTLTPDLGFDNARIWVKAGAMNDRYGMAGRYDAGEYDTYMFGRTHVIGETFHFDYDLNNLWTLYLEQGLGSHKPDPAQDNNARFTMLHHEHVGLKKGRDLEFGAHYLYSWSQEEFRPFLGGPDAYLTPRDGLPNGKMWVAGVEARAELGAFGYVYGAYSHVGADYALTVSRAIEVLHSSGGGEYDFGIVGNYLDSPNCHRAENPNSDQPPGAPPSWQVLDPNGCSDGNGSVDALHAQYEFSLTNFTQQIDGGPRFWGNGFDAILKLYGLVAFVKSEARDTTKVPVGGDLSADSPEGYRPTKLKYGADLTVQALPFLSPGIRFDRVEPNSLIPEQSFAILSPRVQFKTQWVTHERITVGYSRYFYDQRTCTPTTMPIEPGSNIVVPNPNCVQPPSSPVPYDGFGSTSGKQDVGTRATGVTRPDENVFKIEATMWW
jgi:hypothetical protein